jgi:hypothetical protein
MKRRQFITCSAARQRGRLRREVRSLIGAHYLRKCERFS